MELNSELERLSKYAPIDKELQRAKKIHPKYPMNIFHQLAIMQEEAGEVTKAVLDFYYADGSVEHIKEELIQTAAMCVRMLEALPEPPEVQIIPEIVKHSKFDIRPEISQIPYIDKAGYSTHIWINGGTPMMKIEHLNKMSKEQIENLKSIIRSKIEDLSFSITNKILQYEKR